MKRTRQRMARPALAMLALAAAPSAWALDYDPAMAYPAGCVVGWQQATYRAKWWTPPGHSPGAVDTVANPWDTSWERAAPGTPTGCPGEPPVPPGPGGPGEGGDPGEPRKVLLSKLLDDEAALAAAYPMMGAVRASIRTLDNPTVEAVQPGRPQNPANVRRVESIVDGAAFDYLFPLRAAEYTYEGFLKGIAKFPAVCAAYAAPKDADAICRKTLATMFAHFAQETGGHEAWRPEEEYRQGLVYVREMGMDESSDSYNGGCGDVNWATVAWPCGRKPDGSFKSYFGRGAKQLSYHYNYGPFSDAMYGDVTMLLDAPERVADTWLNLGSAVFFHAYPQPPKPSMLHVIDGTWQPNAADIADGRTPGFGVTTMIINGGVECGGTGPEHAASANRITYYRAFAARLGVPVDASEKLGCRQMKEFTEASTGALPIYWENNWTDEPGCKLVGYQTAHSALKPGDYVQCVRTAFPEVEIVDDTQG
ncbi:glycoside hydrolase family 19 protein [Luteibacter yeojuensis]|uniref:glycoside hydrolase family 19 protein n=1 Tax=Luteibacter yeojuensis TaxID=345309 RepID=UPI000B248489|nr:glycoside hydrolase family 19 protein [Luteibacter yeojuensis]